MGLFSKKEKPAAAPGPDTAPSNPYATSSAPSYDSYGGGNNSGGYGGSSYGGGGGGGYGGSPYGGGNSYGSREPTGYGGAPEPTGYGGSGNKAPSNPYGGGSNPYGGGSNPYGGTSSPYGASDRKPQNSGPAPTSTKSARPVDSNPYGGGSNPYGGDNPYGASGNEKGSYGYGSGGYSASEGYNAKDPYSTGDSRQLTAEQEEEEDADALKQQIRFTKQESVASTRNALRAAARAEEVGRDTLTRLGEQGEKLHQTEMNIALAKTHGDVAADQADHLRRLNRSMFVPVVSPFGKTARAQKEEEKIMERHAAARAERERIQQAGMNGQHSVQGGLRQFGQQPGGAPRQKMSLAEKAKYQFEADEEDDQMEEEIDDNLYQLGQAAGRLKGLAQATGQVVDGQKGTIDRLNDSTQVVDDQIAKNSHKLKKFGF